MSRNQHLRDIISGLEKRIREHEEKIVKEAQKGYPDWSHIDHWRKEIRRWEVRRNRLLDRLHRRRHRR